MIEYIVFNGVQTIKRFFAVLFAFTLIFSLSACGASHPALKTLKKDIAVLDKGTPETPSTVKLAEISFSTEILTPEGCIGWGQINRIVKQARKYLVLDLSDCSVSDNRITGSSLIKESGRQSIVSVLANIDNDMNIIYDNPYIKGIILPSTLRTIGFTSFADCNYLDSVTIPSSVTSIQLEAFADCSGLSRITVDEENPAYASEDGVLFTKDKRTLVKYPAAKSNTSYTIPNGVTLIGEEAFLYCLRLRNVTIPNSVITIGEDAFYGCINLDNVTIPNSVTSIEDSAFWGCENLHSIAIPNSVTAIGSGVFYGCESLESITIPDSVTVIEHTTFLGCENLRSIVIPNSVTVIGSSAFYDCTSLTNVIIPNSVSSIESHAFNDCISLESITLSNSITEIKYGTFSGCESLYNIIIPDGVILIEDGVFFSCSSLESITIPNSVSIIEDAAFVRCDKLKSVTLPANITDFGDYIFPDDTEGYGGNVLKEAYKAESGGAGTYERSPNGNDWHKVSIIKQY